ncbi:MAG: hypothetical protein JSV33_06245 [bacterium]|nr:MAG: hypothetical protein JSV33_06245 [bacterium]
MAPEDTVPGWRFWLQWVLVSCVGYAVGCLAGFVLGHLLLGNVMIGIGTGAVTGLLQWLLLRRYIRQSGWWVLASTLGLGVSLGLYGIVHLVWMVPFHMGWPLGILGWGLAYLLGGALVGLPQQRILRRSLARSAWWVPVSAAGWALSVLGTAIQPTDSHLPTVLIILRNGMAGPAVAGIILGIITGAGLVWLLRQPIPAKQQ